MATTLKLTKKQEEMLYLLRLDGLRREIELHEAEEAYNKAVEIEKAVQQHVIDNNEYYSEDGERITNGDCDYLMSEEVFVNDYLPKVKTAYMDLYGIDNPLNFVYSSPMLERKLKAEKAYRMIAVDFLKISGRAAEAAQLEKAVKSYLSPKLEAQLMAIIRSFIDGK
jgi:hypothetical protein